MVTAVAEPLKVLKACQEKNGCEARLCLTISRLLEPFITFLEIGSVMRGKPFNFPVENSLIYALFLAICPYWYVFSCDCRGRSAQEKAKIH